jgi:hypothetical protein
MNCGITRTVNGLPEQQTLGDLGVLAREILYLDDVEIVISGQRLTGSPCHRRHRKTSSTIC